MRALDIVVFGRAYTPDYDLLTPPVNVFKVDQMNADLVRQTIGLPVFIEHDTRYDVGYVFDAFIDEFRNLNTFLYISGNDMVNELLPAALREKFYTGLSMGTDVVLDERSKCYTTVAGVRPTEVSLVRTPDRPNAMIEEYWVVPRYVENKTAFVKNLTRRCARFE